MRFILDLFRGAAVAALLACGSLAFAATAATEIGTPIGLAPASHDATLDPIAVGFDRWLQHALEQAGRPPTLLPGSDRAGMDAAVTAGLEHALVPRLRGEAGRVVVRLVLYSPTTGQVIAASESEDALASLGSAAADAFKKLEPALGIASGATPTPLLSELASATRAITRVSEGQLFDAWWTVQGKQSPIAVATRKKVLDAARRSKASPAERARVLNAAGDLVGAWGLVGSAATLDLRKQEPDPMLLLAAAEIQLSRENPRLAMRFLDVAVLHAPDSAAVQNALGHARLAQNNPEAAREALLLAARLDPDDLRALEMLSELDAEHPKRGAAHWLELAKRSAHQLEPERARHAFEQAMALDPSVAGLASTRLGDLEAHLGQPSEARDAYRQALDAGASDVAVLVGKGRAEHLLGDKAAAETTLRRAVTLAPKDAPALVALGAVLAEDDRKEEALPLLRAAHAIQPADTMTNLTLARALRLSGAYGDALDVLATGGNVEDVVHLRELARIQAAAGDLDGAKGTLLRATRLEPDDPRLIEQRATLLEAAGDPTGAASDRALIARLTDATGAEPLADSTATTNETTRRIDFDAMAASFADGLVDADKRSVVFLGIRESGSWKNWLRRLTRLREPDEDAVRKALLDALAARFGDVHTAGAEIGALENYVDRLFRFERRESLSADVISAVNGVLAKDGVFVSRIVSHPRDRRDIDCPSDTFAIETRLLTGSSPESVQILAAADCVAGGLDAYAAWNLEAILLYTLIAMLLFKPIVQGWGTVVVRIKLPEKTKGFFSIHVTSRADQVKRDIVDKKTGREKIRATGRLDFLKRFERHMAGAETRLRWIPARKREYTVTVGGPLLDARGEEIIGHFLEEQKILVGRGGVTELTYDFRPKECAVEIKISHGEQPATDARVAVVGDVSSLRYARDGVAFIYLEAGEYTILVGSKDAVAEFQIAIESLESAVPLAVDLDECPLVFRDCPDAVEPYLMGDLATVAEVLERADNPSAPRLRADLLERQGRAGEAATELESVGDLGHAAQLRAAGEDHSGSAALYEQAGDLTNAAAAHRAAGEWEDAARCYEEIYDYGNALECWREMGNDERELELLEKLGEYQDAAQIARSMGDVDRAIRNLQQVDARHPHYKHTCRVIAEIVSERGDHELAVAKFQEAIGTDGLANASMDVLESYAGILERAGKREEAVATYEAIQRRDVARTDLTTRIQDLRTEAENLATRAVVSGTAATQQTPTPTVESRYELLEEIGRGGMGVVYKARDKRLGRIIALKQLPESMREHPSAVELFEREARAAAALNHQNIVTLFDAGEENGCYFISMELLEGRALNEIVAKNRRISVRDTARIGIQIAAGMHYAHERRIVHRDIKTANLFFTNDQVVKIMDFGIAKSLEEVRRSTTVVGGTPYYMAPEQALGKGVDHRADIYAFGVTLFQLATGALPFSEGDVTYLHAHEPPPDPRELEVKIPAELAELILHMMAKAADDRPASAAEVGDRLRALLQAQG